MPSKKELTLTDLKDAGRLEIGSILLDFRCRICWQEFLRCARNANWMEHTNALTPSDSSRSKVVTLSNTKWVYGNSSLKFSRPPGSISPKKKATVSANASLPLLQ